MLLAICGMLTCTSHESALVKSVLQYTAGDDGTVQGQVKQSDLPAVAAKHAKIIQE